LLKNLLNLLKSKEDPRKKQKLKRDSQEAALQKQGKLWVKINNRYPSKILTLCQRLWSYPKKKFNKLNHLMS